MHTILFNSFCDNSNLKKIKILTFKNVLLIMSKLRIFLYYTEIVLNGLA